jgi:hypothetical protein
MGRAEVVRQLLWGIWSRRGRGSELSELGRALLPVGEEGEWVSRVNVLERSSAVSKIKRRRNDS